MHETMLNVELVAVTPDAEEVIERCGKVAWNSRLAEETERRDAFIQKLIKLGHTSVLEHASATFYVTGISRACSHQLVRHRIASYTQRSQRYVDEGEGSVIVPPSISTNETRLVFEEAMDAAFSFYQELRRQGVPKEDARFVLPNACETRIAISMNFRELRHFFKERCEKTAQWEIRDMATYMLELVYREAPAVFGDMREKFPIE